MRYFKIHKIYLLIIILFFLISYVFFSYGKPPLFTLTEGPGDVFYYLVYGREAAEFKFFSWNGLYPSNGFHPLWLFFVSVGFFVSKNLSIVIIILSVFLFIFLLISFYYFNKIVKIYDDKLVQIISIFIFASLCTEIYFWYMESALSILLFLIYFHHVISKFDIENKIDILNSTKIGILSALIALTRLDMVLLIFPIHGFLILNLVNKKNFISAISLTIPPVLLVGAYVTLIYYITGAPVPLSGVVKSSFPHIFRDTDWSQLLTKQTNYGIFATILTFFCITGSHFLSKLKKNNIGKLNQNHFIRVVYLLLLGAFLHTTYHISFSDTGSIGRWYFSIHFVIAIIAIISLIYNIKKILNNLSIFDFLNQKNFRYFFVLLTLPIIFYLSILSRSGHDFKKTETYTIKKFTEILEKKDFDKSFKIYDGTDGTFAFYTKIPTFHVKGMAATPDYVFKKKEMFNQSCEFIKNFLLDEKIDYVLRGIKINKGSNQEKEIKNKSDYNTFDHNEDLVIHYYLQKTEIYLKNNNNC